MPTTKAPKIGKTKFVRQMLSKNPYANATAVNEAWRSTGESGTISATLVNKQRAALGLSGNLRAKKKGHSAATRNSHTSRKNGGQKSKSMSNGSVHHAASHANGKKFNQPAIHIELRGNSSRRHESVAELEADIDRLLFKVMGLGGLTAIEESLRQARRLLYGAFSR